MKPNFFVDQLIHIMVGFRFQCLAFTNNESNEHLNHGNTSFGCWV